MLPSCSICMPSMARMRRDVCSVAVALLVTIMFSVLVLRVRYRAATDPALFLSSSLAYKALYNSGPRPTPQERLEQLNTGYAPGRWDGFGVGSVDLSEYKRQLVQFIHDMHLQPGESSNTGLPEPDTDSLVRSIECQLDHDCRRSSSVARIPRTVLATSSNASSFQSPQMLQWHQINPSYVDFHLFTDEDVFNFMQTHFPPTTSPLTNVYRALPLEIVKYDWFRYLALMLYGGFYTDIDTYPLRPLEDLLSNALPGIQDRTDRSLLPEHDPNSAPGLIVGIECLGAQRNKWNPLYSRSQGIVQWTFGASAGHPVLVEAAKRVFDHSVRAEEGERTRKETKDALPFKIGEDPMKKLVVEWSGPALFTDCVARYLQTLYGVSLSSISQTSVPLRIGDVLLLPIGSLQVPKHASMRWLNWALGRSFHPWSRRIDVLRHDHEHSWWNAKLRQKMAKEIA